MEQGVKGGKENIQRWKIHWSVHTPRDGEGWGTREENKGKVILLKSNIWDMGSFLSHLP